jgi:hypothetical protein
MVSLVTGAESLDPDAPANVAHLLLKLELAHEFPAIVFSIACICHVAPVVVSE